MTLKSQFPSPSTINAQQATELWNSPIREFFQYFQLNACPLFAEIIDGKHAKPSIFDFGPTFIGSYSNPLSERFFLAQQLIIKHLLVLRVLTYFLPAIQAQYKYILTQTPKAKYIPIETPLPASLLDTTKSISESLFIQYNHLFQPHELEKINERRYIHDLLQTYEFVHSLYIQIGFYQREIAILQTLDIGNQHSLFVQPSTLSNNNNNNISLTSFPSPQIQQSSSIASTPSAQSGGDFNPNNRRGSSAPSMIGSQTNSNNNNNSTATLQSNFFNNGGFVPEDLRYTQPIDKLWYLWFQYHRYTYQSQLDQHVNLYPAHLEIDPTNPSSPIQLHQTDILAKIVQNRTFSLRVMGIDLEQFFEPNSSNPLLPIQYGIISEPAIYSISNVNLNDFNYQNPLYIHFCPASNFDQEYNHFSYRRNLILANIQLQNKQPTIEELTSDAALFPLIGSGGFFIPQLPLISLAHFLPNLDKLNFSPKNNQPLLEYNRTILNRSCIPYDPSQFQFYSSQSHNYYQFQLLMQNFQNSGRTSLQQNSTADFNQFGSSSSDQNSQLQLTHNNSSHGSSQVPSNPSNSDRDPQLSLDESTSTAPHSIAPTAFFTLLVEFYGKKQSIYKSFPKQRSIPFVCKLYNKTLLGGKDYKKDYLNVQSLYLKHFIIIEQLYIKHREIFNEYTGFVFGVQDEPELDFYFTRTRELRQKYCPQVANQSPPPNSISSTPQKSLDWSILPPDPLNFDSQQWLQRALQQTRTDFMTFHQPVSQYEKDDLSQILSTLFTTLLPSTYQLIYFLKRQCFFMVEECLILRSLLQETFRFVLKNDFPEVSLEIILTDWNDRFLSLHERKQQEHQESFKKDGKFQQDKYNKDILANGHIVPNDNTFWTAKTLTASKESGGFTIRSHVISPLDELRLQMPQDGDVIDLEKFMVEIKMLTPRQQKWLQEFYPQTWAYVDRPPLPSTKLSRGI